MILPGETRKTVIATLLKIAQRDGVLHSPVIKNVKKGVADIKAGRAYTSRQEKDWA